MPTLAQKHAKNPTAAIQAVIDEVQAVADNSQSFAYRFEDLEDGSRLEIRCAPIPRFTQVPEGPVDHAGALAHVDGHLLRVFPIAAIDRARAELDERIIACESAIAADPEDKDAQAAREAANAALEQMSANLAAGEQTGSHVAIPADDKTVAFHDELGAGGNTLIAH